ncbi:MAG: DoxX family protein, partial [Anaerolineae bacterium]
IPAPVLFGWIVTLVELVGGLLLIVGLFTRLCALLIGAVMIVAILTVKAKMGLIVPGAAGAELDLAILAGVLALAFIGAGPLSLDRQLQLEPVPAADRG